MIPDIKELNFPKKDGEQYATLTQATVTLADMGEKTITTQVKINGEITPDFSQDWAVEFQGEKYIMPLRIPQGSKGNESLDSTIDLTFQHWAIYQLKRYPFVTMQPIETGTAIADEEAADVRLNLKDFCILFGQVLEYYYGDAITIDLNPLWEYKKEAESITINHSYIWDVLIKFYELFAARWVIEPREDNNNTVKGGERYVIRVGYPSAEVTHIFRYGFEGGLLKIERQVQSEDIRNMLKGRGGDTNIPFRYFKDTDPNNPDFKPDPDWIEELKNIYFTNLMPATFRSYIQGWKAAHISKYPGYTAVGENNAYAPWAYRKGYTDTKFRPVEFVADEITINPTAGDKQVEILPGYSPYIKKGSSIDKYGPLLGSLDNNDKIYPTLQGTGMDIAVDVEQVTSDVVESPKSDTKTEVLEEFSGRVTLSGGERKTLTIDGGTFSVDAGLYGNYDEGQKGLTVKKNETQVGLSVIAGKWTLNIQTYQVKVGDYLIDIEDATLSIVNISTQQILSASGLPSGNYRAVVRLSLHNTSDNTLSVEIKCARPTLTTSSLKEQARNTFDVWIPNVWGTARNAGETDAQYAERVWKPVFGDREGNEAALMFTSGALAHEDYEFKFIKGLWPVLDSTKTYNDDEGVTHSSYWRLRLAKSDAEMEVTGLYLPSTQKQGAPGDTFVFIGTELTHVPYVVDAEVRQADWLNDQLGEVKEIKPTFVVTPDRVRLNGEGKPNALIRQLRVGSPVTIEDKRFIGGSQQETLYLQSITYKYRAPSSTDAALNPDMEIVLGNDYSTVANPVTMIQGEVSSLSRQISGALSNISQAVRATGDKIYIRKDKSDRTPYSLTIGGRATAEAGMQFGLTYIPGLAGGMGGWIGPDGAGELRSLILWSFLEVPELRFNRVEIVQGVDWHAPGGGIVESCEGDTVTLKLEEGDYGAVAEDDLCLGIWHFARPADKARCNLLKDTATPQTAASSGPTDNFRFVRYKFDVPVDFKAGDSFVLSLDNVERLAGTATEFHARLYDMDDSQSVRMISSLVKFNAADRTCVLTVVNPSSSSTVELLLYAGLNGETAGNSVRFTRPMLVRGETPAEWNYAESEFDGLNSDSDSNDSETGKGLFRFTGFATMYFRIKAVSGDNNGTATIQMREGYEHLRPQPGMHFVAFGNRTRKDRQTCRYATRTYERLMKDVDDWTFRPDNIKLQFGDLSNLTIDGLTMSGYSAYLNNVYFDGVLRQLENSPLRLTYETYGDKYVGDNDDCMIRLTALKGVEDVTDSVTWSVSASTGAATPSVTPEGTLTLGKSVLAGGEEATVTVTATWRKTPDAAPKTASAIIIIRDNALLKGETGSSYTPNLLKGTKTWDTAGWGYGTGMGWGSEPDGEMNGFTVLHGNFEGHGTQAYIELAQQFFPVVKGQTYTLSFWAKGTGNMRTFCYPAVNGFLLPGGTGDRSNITLSDTEQVYQLTTDWKRHRVSFRVDGTPASENTRILFRVPAGNEAWIAGAKLETGINNNPEWSPNDEDLKGDPGKDGEDAVIYDWETEPAVIRCEADGTPVDTSVTVRCWRVKGETRSLISPNDLLMSMYRVQSRVQADEGISNWADYTAPVTLDSRETHPKIMLRVIPQTIAGSEPEVLSEHTVGYVCDGTTGPQGSVVRIRGLFEAGEYYYDGETPVTTSTGSKIRWLDVVWVEDISGNRYYKRCIKSGTYDSSNGPHSTDNETSTGWADFSQLDNLIVQLLIAKNAHIQFLNGQEIVFGETVNGADKLWGRIGVPTEGGGYIMWAGGADTSLATYILDKEGRARFGKINDNHIVIDPLEKQITVRNGSRRKMITIDGADHMLENIYGVEDNINAGNLNRGYATANPTYTTTVSAGTVKLAKAGGKLKVSLTAILETWSVGYTGKDSAGVSMPGQYVKGTATVTLGIYNGSIPVKEVSATVQSPILTENLKGYRTEDLTVEATNLSVGTYTVRTKVELVQQKDTDINGRIVQATAMATVMGAAKVFSSPELYEAFLCGNGFISANSMRDYFRSVKTTSGYMTEASAGDYGVRVSDDGLAAKDSNGAWNAGIMTYEKEAVDANKCVLPQLGIRMYTTNANTANLPTGAGTRYGSITTTTLNATDGHHIQEWKSFSQPVQCYTRRCMNNVWGAWTKNY